MTDIFSVAKEKVVPDWAKFVNPGDSFQGTYVGKIVGQIDGYGNEQIIYQLLKDDGKLVNVGFGLNKKFLHNEMQTVTFGQIVGFRYKGKLTVKDKKGKPVEVKDFALFQDPKIVNEAWLKENKDNMPSVSTAKPADDINADDIPFSSEGSITNDDKLAAIIKLAKEKLGVTTDKAAKDKVMTTTGVAPLPVNYDKILETLTKL